MKTYLGDAAYAELTPYGVRLTTENGYRATNTVEMEPEVLQAFLEWIEQVKLTNLREI